MCYGERLLSVSGCLGRHVDGGAILNLFKLRCIQLGHLLVNCRTMLIDAARDDRIDEDIARNIGHTFHPPKWHLD